MNKLLSAPEDEDPPKYTEKVQVEIHTCDDNDEKSSHFTNIDLDPSEVQFRNNVISLASPFVLLDHEYQSWLLVP